MAARMWRNQISYIAGKNVYSIATLESSCAPGHLSQKNEILCIWVFIAALFIKAKSWKQPKCTATDEWVTKQQYIHRILPSNKREQIPNIFKNLDGYLRGIILSEKSPSQKLTYCGSTYVTFWKWQNYRYEEMINGYLGLGNAGEEESV